jgi:D-glycero-D-manno-heptose 1,7-bisphosphate phosphatase
VQVEAINASLCTRLALDEVLCCYHDDADGCTCRKPLPGMILDASQRHGLAPVQSFVVGDRWRDVEAGRRAGCTTILLRQGYSEAERSKPDYEAPDLPGAVDIILRCLMEPLT